MLMTCSICRCQCPFDFVGLYNNCLGIRKRLEGRCNKQALLYFHELIAGLLEKS